MKKLLLAGILAFGLSSYAHAQFSSGGAADQPPLGTATDTLGVGIQILPSATANTQGTPVTLTTATTNATYTILIMAGKNNDDTVGQGTILRISSSPTNSGGSCVSPTILIDGIVIGYAAQYQPGGAYILAPINIPAGTCLQASVQSSIASSTNYLSIDVDLFTGGFGAGAIDNLSGNLSTSLGTPVTPTTTGIFGSTFTTLVSSTSRAYKGFWYEVDSQATSSGDYVPCAFQLATGGSGSEVPFGPTFMLQNESGAFPGAKNTPYLPYNVPSGTRISVRSTCSGAQTAMGIALHGVSSASFVSPPSLPCSPCYYVSNSGNDSNNGTSQATPWKTTTKVNGSSYAPGSGVLFQTGGSWTGELVPPSSGTSGLPITFGSYGSGAQPIISGTGTGTYVLYINGKNYVTITGINFENGTQTYSSYISGGNAVVINGNTFQNNTGDGLRFDTTTNPIVSGNTFADNGGSGVEFYFTPNMQVLNNIVHDNVQVNNSYDAGIKADGAADSTVSIADVSTGVVITGNLAYNNGIAVGSVNVFTGAGIWIDTIGTGTIISYNLLYNNNDGGVNVDHTPGTIVTYNVAYNNLFSGIAAYADCGCGLDGYPAQSGALIYGNTLVGNTYGITVSGPSAGEAAGGCVNNTVKNNIVVNSTTANMRLITGCENPGTNGSGNVYTYNNMGVGGSTLVTWGGTFGGGGTNYTSYSSWETASGNCGSTGCSHSVQSAPTFTNASAHNYTLLSGDPDIDVGVNLGTSYQLGLNPTSAWPAGVTTLNQNSYGTGWEIGAYVFP